MKHKLGRIESMIKERNWTVEEQLKESKKNSLIISVLTLIETKEESLVKNPQKKGTIRWRLESSKVASLV